MKSYRFPDTHCPHCGHQVNRARDDEGNLENPGEGNTGNPGPGDLAICVYCSEFSEYVEAEGALHLHKPSPAALALLANDIHLFKKKMRVLLLPPHSREEFIAPDVYTYAHCPDCDLTFIVADDPPEGLTPCCGRCKALNDKIVKLEIRRATPDDVAEFDERPAKEPLH